MGEKTSVGEEIIDTLELRKVYEDRKPNNKRLLELVKIILDSAIERNNLKVHSIKYRVKDYPSFIEKVERKRYTNPLKECTDLAGCRIVCLFLSQIDDLMKIIKQEFDVVEITDKRTSKKFDQFGYLSLHMLVKIPKNRINFVEYHGLDDFICEIQVRTILQEAWAEIEHYLNYKSTKEERNQELLRKIFSLAGMFEVADSTFQDINKGFTQLVEKKLPENNNVITSLSLYKFSKDYFKWYDSSWDQKEERSFFKLSNEMKKTSLRTVNDLKVILDKYRDDLIRYEDFHREKSKKQVHRFFAPVGLIRAALALEYGRKFDLAFGLKGYSDKVKSEIVSRKNKKYY